MKIVASALLLTAVGVGLGVLQQVTPPHGPFGGVLGRVEKSIDEFAAFALAAVRHEGFVLLERGDAAGEIEVDTA